MNTSPGLVRPANFWRTRAMASGMEPRCRGRVRPCAMRRPSASQRAQDMSMAFFRLFEYAVRTSAMAISSTMVSSAFLISSSKMGSLSSRVGMLLGSEGGLAPLPKPPPRKSCAGQAGARTRPVHVRFPNSERAWTLSEASPRSGCAGEAGARTRRDLVRLPNSERAWPPSEAPRGRVAPAKRALERGWIMSGSRVDDDVAMGVEVRGFARGYEGCCVVLVDKYGTGTRRGVEILPVDDRCAQHAMRGAEVGLTCGGARPRSGDQPHFSSRLGTAVHARGQPQIDDLDGIALGLVAVGALMLLAKGLGEPGNRVRATRAGAERYRELIGLSLVLEVGAPLDLHMAPVALGTQERLHLALQRGEGGGEIAWVEVGQRPQEGAHEVVLHLGLEETEGAPHAGSGGHEDGGDLERPRHLRGEERAVAAEGDEGELLRIAAALDGDGAHRPRHPRASQEIDAVGGLMEVEVETLRDLLGHRAPSALGVEGESAGKPLGMEVAEAHVRVGEGRLSASEPVAHWSGHRSRAPRTHVECACGVHADDASATRSHLCDVEGGDA